MRNNNQKNNQVTMESNPNNEDAGTFANFAQQARQNQETSRSEGYLSSLLKFISGSEASSIANDKSSSSAHSSAQDQARIRRGSKKVSNKAEVPNGDAGSFANFAQQARQNQETSRSEGYLSSLLKFISGSEASSIANDKSSSSAHSSAQDQARIRRGSKKVSNKAEVPNGGAGTFPQTTKGVEENASKNPFSFLKSLWKNLVSFFFPKKNTDKGSLSQESGESKARSGCFKLNSSLLFGENKINASKKSGKSSLKRPPR